MYKYLWIMSAVSGVFFVLGCNPFLSEKSGLGQACVDDSDCLSDLVCHAGYCEKKQTEDCSQADCSAPGLDGQGKDTDLDGWGACCDCDDEHAEVNPGVVEIPYNDKDDDCNTLTSDDDFDKDGYDAQSRGGDDCDDTDESIHPNAVERCNGIDDDCDGDTDEDFDIGSPCDGVGECLGGVLECATESTTICSTMPGGSDDSSSEEICDGKDNDCDGDTDEDALVLEAESGDEATDGIDNNCNGLIDEKGGVMVPVPDVPNVWIDAYETTIFENPDCTGARYGESSDDYPAGFPADGQNVTTTLYACSLPGIIPSGYMSRYRAQFACLAQGKRLCTEDEFVRSCASGASFFPYDSLTFDPGACNDPKGGAGSAQPTGSYSECSANNTFDMSGNLAEWIAKDVPGQDPPVGFVASWSYSNRLCHSYGQDCLDVDIQNTSAEEMGLLKRVLSCPIQDEGLLKYPINTARADFGGRCCVDGPNQ